MHPQLAKRGRKKRAESRLRHLAQSRLRDALEDLGGSPPPRLSPQVERAGWYLLRRGCWMRPRDSEKAAYNRPTPDAEAWVPASLQIWIPDARISHLRALHGAGRPLPIQPHMWEEVARYIRKSRW